MRKKRLDRVCLEIEDNGPGVDQETQKRIFEPFFTTKGEKRGTGLGLAVVYGILQNHKGFVDVRSRKDVGSTFRVYLPILEEEVRQEDEQIAPSRLTVGKGTILLAEDDHQVRDMIIRTLKKLGVEHLSVSELRRYVLEGIID